MDRIHEEMRESRGKSTSLHFSIATPTDAPLSIQLMRMESARQFSFHFLYTLLHHEVDGLAIDVLIVDMPRTTKNSTPYVLEKAFL